MQKKRVICCVITARPSYSRIKTALIAIDNHPDLVLKLVLSGSALLEKYGNVAKIIQDDGFTISNKIYIPIEGGTPNTMVKATGLATIDLATVFDSIKPHFVISVADRFETLATSIAAAYQNIPLVHIQGGEVTGSIDEKVRHANTKLADIHLVASEDAKQRVIKMGEDEKTVFNTGCPSLDLAYNVLKSKNLSFDPFKKYTGVGNIKDWKSGYIVCMQHSVTTEFLSAGKQVLETLNAVNNLDIPTFWFWPNIDAGTDDISHVIRQFRELRNPNNICFFKNMAPEDFLSLLKNSQCLVGNSSVGIRESSLLGIPVVNIGTRQNRRERSINVVDCDYDNESISNSIKSQMKHGLYEPKEIYGNGYSGQKIADLLAIIDPCSNKVITY